MLNRTYPYYGASGVIDHVEDYIFDEPTVLIAEDGANLLSRTTPLAFIADGKYWVNNHAHILKPRLGPFRYWAHLLCTADYEPWVTGAAQPKLTKENLGSIKVPVPPLDEQTRIAAFLDEKTAEIDAAIAKKQRLIELLQEQKAILINRAVTRGIDPNAPLRDSGVDWIGEMPAHWEVSRSKRLFTTRKERARPEDIQLSATQAYGVISQQEYMEREGRRVTQITEHLDKRAHVEIDDFVISMRSFEGGLERAWAAGCIRSSYVVLEPSPQVNVDFFTYLFKSQAYIQALRRTANFIRDGQDLNFDNFALVDLPVIPYDEQQAIADYLRQATDDLARGVALIQREIELLSEYRSILISDAVTGKIKV